MGIFNSYSIFIPRFRSCPLGFFSDNFNEENIILFYLSNIISSLVPGGMPVLIYPGESVYRTFPTYTIS